jgi:dihydroorotate dehydrogenase (fumarate)
MSDKIPAIQPPITNASGPLSVAAEELHALGRSAAGAIVTKSMTHCPREGNPEPRLATRINHNLGSINSMGLNNLGYQRYAELIPELKQYKKPVIASVSYAPCKHNLPLEEQYLVIAKALEAAGADMLEVNLSTPNLTGIPIATDPENIRRVMEPLKREVRIPLSVKLPPYNNSLMLFQEVAALLLELGVDAVVTMNSEPNTIDIDIKTRTKLTKPREGYGGLGGPAILPIALAEVHRFYRYFQGRNAPIAVWGCGGITTPEDAIKHFLAGASVVQVGTALLWEGVGVFEKLWQGIERWLQENGFASVSEIVGTVCDL